ncbi:MAG: YceK/YidQ family lipoprotein [Planctomyces sp.]|nr:YceK/YidQ family lipoprotein [Planctomyces sp.]
MRWFASVCVLLSGCSTLLNCTTWIEPPSHENAYRRPFQIYGGVKIAIAKGAAAVRAPHTPGRLTAGAAWLAVDAPLSLVADTVTLPCTLWLSYDLGLQLLFLQMGSTQLCTDSLPCPDGDGSPSTPSVQPAEEIYRLCFQVGVNGPELRGVAPRRPLLNGRIAVPERIDDR